MNNAAATTVSELTSFLAGLQSGMPIDLGDLAIVPILRVDDAPDVDLLDEGVKRGKTLVTEVSESGVLVYPRVPVPKGSNRDSAPKVPKKDGPAIDKMRIILAAAGLVIGLLIGFVLRPMLSPDGRIDELQAQIDTATKGTGLQKDRADAAEKSLETAQKARDVAVKELGQADNARAELAAKAAEGDRKIKESEEA